MIGSIATYAVLPDILKNIIACTERLIGNKQKSTVPLCPDCHRNSPRAVHRNNETDFYLKKIAQLEFESKYSYELWMQVFGKNYR